MLQLVGPTTRCLPSKEIPVSFWKPWDRHFKIVVRSRESHEILWQLPFATELEAQLTYFRLIGLDIDRLNKPFQCPPIWQDGELEYVFSTIVTFNASNTDNTKDW